MASIWKQTATRPNPPKSHKPEGIWDTAVIGGGMTGVLCALMLARKGGGRIAVLEKGLVGGGVSGMSTGKLTAQHRLIYHELAKTRGESVAAAYAKSHTEAIRDVADICNTYNISCDLECKDNILYTRSEQDFPCFHREAEAALRCGLDVVLETQADLPINTVKALRTRGQAQFHPLKFLYGAAQAAESLGVTIFEHTRVTGIQNGKISTGKGELRAQQIIIASHYPFLDKWGMYFLKIYQSRSYVLALSGAAAPPDMAVDADRNGLSFRSMSHETLGTLTLLGGCAHKTGTQGSKEHYASLCEIARKLYPDARLVAKWSSQDCMTHDGVPYIGLHSAKRHDTSKIYVATGFNKWGMSTAVVAANMLSDMIVKGFSPYQEVYSPNRAGAGVKPSGFIPQLGLIAGGLARGLYRPPNQHGLCPRCTHMRSALTWNNDEQTWDCPAHGSRFNEAGCVEDTPAQDFLHKG